MKKLFSVLLLSIILVGALVCVAACDNSPEGQLVCYVPDGAPALSVANIMADKKVGNADVEVVVSTGKDVVAKCTAGEADMAVLPTNSAVKICSERDDYQLFSVNVYGVLYVVGTQQISSLADLKGKVVHSIGLGNTPEYVFSKVLENAGIAFEKEVDSAKDDNTVGIKYYDDASSILPLILNGNVEFALIGEPSVTNLKAKAAAQNLTIYNLFDLQEEWKNAVGSDENGYPQASMIVKKSWLETDGFAKALKQTIKANEKYLLKNLDTLNELMQSYGSSLNVAYTKEVIESCNLNVVMAKNAKSDVETYLSAFPKGFVNNYLPDGKLKDGVCYEH